MNNFMLKNLRTHEMEQLNNHQNGIKKEQKPKFIHKH